MNLAFEPQTDIIFLAEPRLELRTSRQSPVGVLIVTAYSSVMTIALSREGHNTAICSDRKNNATLAMSVAGQKSLFQWTVYGHIT